MQTIKRTLPGLLLCIGIACPCWVLGVLFPIIGGPVFAILVGMIIAAFWKGHASLQTGIKFSSKKVLQYAVILLGFGLNLTEIARVGATSLPIICSTIATALIVAYLLNRVMKLPGNVSTLIGVGSSICGGSAIAATAPVVKASDEEVARSISVIFLFNVLAALTFPTLGTMLGLTNEGFGLFAGTAVNDTSSVTAAAAAWDGMHEGASTLDYATVVKLTRTLAIIPITLVLALWQMRAAKRAGGEDSAVENPFSFKRVFPMFILWFLAASLITTLAAAAGVDASAFAPLKTLSKFMIVIAMVAIGLNTDIVKLVRTGTKPLAMGGICWICIACVSLGMQQVLGLW